MVRQLLRLLSPKKGLSAALALTGLLLAAVQLTEATLFGAIIDRLTRGEEILPAALAWGGLGAVGIGLSAMTALFADRLAHRIKVEGLSAAFQRVMTLPPRASERGGSGRILRTLVAGSEALFAVVLTLFRDHVTAVSAVLFVLPLAVVLNPALSIVLLAFGTLFAVTFGVVTAKAQIGQRLVEARVQEVYSRVGDVVGNVAIVQAFGQLAGEAQTLRAMTAGILRAQYPVLSWWAFLAILTRSAGTISLIVTVTAGAFLVERGQATVGEIVTFVGFASLVIAKLEQIGSGLTRILVQAPVLRALSGLLSGEGAPPETAGAKALGAVTGHVVFEGVTLRFEDGGTGVEDLSFEAQPGQTVALVGPTGSGKTTTLALLQRFRDPQGGRITIDGTDVKAVTLESLRRSLATVFQEAGLLNRSVAENLLVAKPGASQEELRAVLARAQLLEAIERKPQGLDFVVGERGEYLSGGERQRLAIARAMLKDAPVLLLDEATSALDPATEAKVKRALDAARNGRTTFAIAHRLSTIKEADVILVLDRGRLVERGTYDSLIEKGGLFAMLVSEAEAGERAAG